MTCIDPLGGVFDVLPDFKALIDCPYSDEIEAKAARFPSLYRYAVMLSKLATGTADGSIKVPR